MANCRISTGITVSCDDLRRVGGVAKRVWVGNIEDLSSTIATGSSYVTNIELSTYQSLYLFESSKFSHEASFQAVKSEGGNVAINQTVILRLFNNDPTDDGVIEDLLTSDVFVIVQTNNDEFFIYGAASGLGLTDGTGGTGRQLADSTVTTLTLTGSERELPKRFLRTDVNTTLAYLEARTA
jgi:hypothetical protein